VASSEQAARELKAAALEQTLVNMGHRRVPKDPQVRTEAASKADVRTPVSDRTWDTVQYFLVDRFPGG
jgi:3-methyladenine DNA glycosylase AlkC